MAPASVKASHKTPVASKKQPVVTTDVVLVEPPTGGAGVDMPADGTAAAVAGPGTPRRLSLDFSDPLAAMQKKHSIFKTHYQTAVSKSTVALVSLLSCMYWFSHHALLHLHPACSACKQDRGIQEAVL